VAGSNVAYMYMYVGKCQVTLWLAGEYQLFEDGKGLAEIT